MTSRPLTDFEQILLGIIAAGPSSGYTLKKDLAASPAGIYQPSSGALYPALRRLERSGLLASQAGVSAGSRTRRMYHITPAGQAAHEQWVRAPVDPATVARDLGLHLVRFVFMERLLTPGQAAAFLASLSQALDGVISAVERYRHRQEPASGRRHEGLALEHGIAVFRASLGWTEHAQRVLAGEPAPGQP